MKSKVIFTCILIAALHLFALLPSCDLFGGCGDTVNIEAPVDHAVLFAYSLNYIENSGILKEFPLDRRNLRISIGLATSDTIDLYTQLPRSFFVSSVLALDCADPILRLTEHIEHIEIWQLSEKPEELTSSFLVDDFSGDLYQELGVYLQQEERFSLNLVYKDSLLNGEVSLLIKTQLSDQRVFSDTLEIILK